MAVKKAGVKFPYGRPGRLNPELGEKFLKEDAWTLSPWYAAIWLTMSYQ
jgi:hypothetical protein